MAGAAGFCAGAAAATVFFTAAFLAAAVGDVFVGLFCTAAFLAGVFLAGVFFAGVFFAAAFFAAGFFCAIPIHYTARRAWAVGWSRVEGVYPDSPAKVAFVMAVGRQAKDHLISEHGIGEELAINLVGWLGDELVCLAQLDMQHGNPKDEDERSDRIAKTATIMRRGWGCDAFTLLAEGWVSTKPEKTRKKDLVEEFAAENSDVDECLSVLHVAEEGYEIHVCALPFSVSRGKKITYGTLLHAEGSQMLRNQTYIDVMIGSLELEPMDQPDDVEGFHLALAMGVADEAGFFLHYDF